MRQIRLALIHNGTEASEAYANSLNAQLHDETVVVSAQDPREIRLALPIRAVPSVAIILFADTLEDEQETASILRQIEQFKQLDDIPAVADGGAV